MAISMKLGSCGYADREMDGSMNESMASGSSLIGSANQALARTVAEEFYPGFSSLSPRKGTPDPIWTVPPHSSGVESFQAEGESTRPAAGRFRTMFKRVDLEFVVLAWVMLTFACVSVATLFFILGDIAQGLWTPSWPEVLE